VLRFLIRIVVILVTLLYILNFRYTQQMQLIDINNVYDYTDVLDQIKQDVKGEFGGDTIRNILSIINLQ
jgi:hypothetical protein